MEELKCKLAYYSYLYAGKLLWGLDCDIEGIRNEMFKMSRYISVIEIQTYTDEYNNCAEPFKQHLKEEIDRYIKSLNRKQYSFCRNCNN